MMYVVRMWLVNLVLRNISGGVRYVQLHRCPLRKVALFIGIQKWNFPLPHLNFWPVTTRPFWRVAKIIYNESFKDNICSIGRMPCAVVWIRRVHLQKQLPEMFLKKVLLKIPQNSPGLQYFFLLFFFSLCVVRKYGWDRSIN